MGYQLAVDRRHVFASYLAGRARASRLHTWERASSHPHASMTKLSMRSDGASFHARLRAKLIEEVKLAVNGDDDEEASAAAGGGGDGRNPKLPRLSLKIKRMRMSRMAAKFL